MPEEQNPAGRDIEFPDWYQVIQNVRKGALLYVNPCFNGTNGSINNPLVPWWLLICLMLCQSKISDLILGDIYFELTLHLWGEFLIISNAILHGFFFQWEEQDGFLNGDKAWQWFLEFNKWRFSKAKCSIRYIVQRQLCRIRHWSAMILLNGRTDLRNYCCYLCHNQSLAY